MLDWQDIFINWLNVHILRYHIDTNNHTVKKYFFLEISLDWFRRGIAEAIWIAKENPSLNRDRGRHTLPPVYNQLLSSRDAHTTQGARDDTSFWESVLLV